MTSGKTKIIALHMNALDHCFTTRTTLQQKADLLLVRKEKLQRRRGDQAIDMNSIEKDRKS